MWLYYCGKKLGFFGKCFVLSKAEVSYEGAGEEKNQFTSATADTKEDKECDDTATHNYSGASDAKENNVKNDGGAELHGYCPQVVVVVGEEALEVEDVGKLDNHFYPVVPLGFESPEAELVHLGYAFQILLICGVWSSRLEESSPNEKHEDEG